ncbi:MAG: DUF4402 domain-containing protein [Cetobacterium sp.]|uniref:DUF4402 domain-containing protein n=1 Tax=Cetobacterium sp. TaxID=2071632 RepID=UPI003F406C04
MKKLLTLLSLTLAMTAFAAPQGNIEDKAEMKVIARVIKPLKVESTGDLDFGDIIQGASANASSGYKITGEIGQLITVTIDNNVTLTNRSDSNDTIEVGIQYKDLPNTIAASGTSLVAINGTLNTANDQGLGVYEGTLTARVQYQ